MKIESDWRKFFRPQTIIQRLLLLVEEIPFWSFIIKAVKSVLEFTTI
jgi:hypothetical protein